VIRLRCRLARRPSNRSLTRTILIAGFDLTSFLNRLLCLVLIPMLMHGNALAHSHAGTGVDEPSDHAACPHIHWPFEHHHHARGDSHDHDRGSNAPHASSKPTCPAESGAVIPLAVEHDANAIFLGTHHPIFAPAFPVGNATSDCELGRSEGMGAILPRLLPSPRRSPLPPDRYAGLPIYLQVASLRL